MESNIRKRLGIFVIYDKDGMVDNYVSYLLQSLMPWLTDLVIVCNGRIHADGYQTLRKFTESILMRENAGYDVSAWKTAMFEFIGMKKMSEYEEVLLFNDSFYGPIYPWKNVFHKMDMLDIDFWGLTKHSETIESVRGRIPEHIQSYFMAVRKRMFVSNDFAEYWKAIDLTDKSFLDVILQHELIFTSYFMERGYQWQVYVKAPALESMQLEKNYNHYYLSPLEMVKEYQCPIVKKKALYEKNLSFTLGEEALEVIKYIEEFTQYPTDLILENLIRLVPKKLIYEAFHMHYILKEHGAAKRKKKKKFLLYVAGGSHWEKFWNINSSKNEDAFEIDMIWTDNDIETTYQNKCMGYDLVGKVKFQENTDALSCLYRNEILWEDMIGDEAYLNQVSDLFDSNPYLGIVYPFRLGENLELTELESSMQSFWCRPEYFVNPEKYLFGTISSEKHMTLMLQDCDHVLESIQKQNYFPDIFNKEDVFCSHALEQFVNSREKIFIFGTGIYGRRMFQFLQEKGRKPEGFVVSDGQQQTDVMGVRTFALSEFADSFGSYSEYGLVVALSKKVQQEVIRNIQNNHVKSVFFL